MKKIVTIGVFIVSIILVCCKNKNSDIQVVEASCGQCNFNLSGKGCDLAVRIDGQAYYVDGTSIKDHGNSHAPDGFCSTIRKARVKGTIVDNRFKSQFFELIPIVEED